MVQRFGLPRTEVLECYLKTSHGSLISSIAALVSTPPSRERVSDSRCARPLLKLMAAASNGKHQALAAVADLSYACRPEIQPIQGSSFVRQSFIILLLVLRSFVIGNPRQFPYLCSKTCMLAARLNPQSYVQNSDY